MLPRGRRRALRIADCWTRRPPGLAQGDVIGESMAVKVLPTPDGPKGRRCRTGMEDAFDEARPCADLSLLGVLVQSHVSRRCVNNRSVRGVFLQRGRFWCRCHFATSRMCASKCAGQC